MILKCNSDFSFEIIPVENAIRKMHFFLKPELTYVMERSDICDKRVVGFINIKPKLDIFDLKWDEM